MASLLTPLLPLLLPTLIPLLPIPPRFRNDRITLISLLSAYILFTFITSDLQISTNPNFYSRLGLARTVEDGAAIKDGWKAWARRNHPDRVGVGMGGQEVFVQARVAYDVLNDETRRWGYDRFGEQVAGWKGVATQREYLVRGVTQSVGFYVVSAGVWFLMRITGQISSNSKTSFWRTLLLPTLLILELSLLLSANPLPILSTLLPSRTQYDHIRFLHNIYLALSMALNQLSPLLFPSPPPAAKPGPEQERELAQTVERLGMLVRVAEREAARMYVEELGPVLGGAPDPQEAARRLEREMEEVLVETRLRGHPAVAPVWERAVQEGRARAAATGASESALGDDEGADAVRRRHVGGSVGLEGRQLE